MALGIAIGIRIDADVNDSGGGGAHGMLYENEDVMLFENGDTMQYEFL